MRKLLLALAILLLPLPASAQTVDAAAEGLPHGWTKYTLCTAEADNGACKDAAGDVIQVDNFSNQGRKSLFHWSVFATQSTASAFDCNIYASDTGYHATQRAKLFTDAADLTPVSDALVGSFAGPFHFFWAECAGITGGVITITAIGAPNK